MAEQIKEYTTQHVVPATEDEKGRDMIRKAAELLVQSLYITRGLHRFWRMKARRDKAETSGEHET